MATPRPLRDVFADLVGAGSSGPDPAALLHAGGYGELSDDLLADALVAYAETAPVEVAEHLAPFVTARTAAGVERDESAVDPSLGLELLTTSPPPGEQVPPGSEDVPDVHGGLDLDFGAGAGDADTAAPGLLDEVADSAAPATQPDPTAVDSPGLPRWGGEEPDPGAIAPDGDGDGEADAGDPDDGLDG